MINTRQEYGKPGTGHPSNGRIDLAYLLDSWDVVSPVSVNFDGQECAVFDILDSSQPICEYRSETDRAASVARGLQQPAGTQLVTAGPDPVMTEIRSKITQVKRKCE